VSSLYLVLGVLVVVLGLIVALVVYARKSAVSADDLTEANQAVRLQRKAEKAADDEEARNRKL
jgi:hypothetical protein